MKCQYCGETNPANFIKLNQRTCKACIYRKNRGYHTKNSNRTKYNDSQLVKCVVCGKGFVRLHYHIKTHGISLKEYMRLYPNSPLYSSVWTDNLKKCHLGKKPWNKGKKWKDDENKERFLWRQQFNHIGQVAWNKGRTKATDIRVAKSANAMAKHVRTKEHCDAISVAKKGRKYPNLIYFLKPNKTELKVLGLLNCVFPNEWVFTGDGKYILDDKSFDVGDLLPDFLNIRNKKQLIEFCGEYWHKNDNPQDRVDYFRKFGYETLVIWGNELKDRKTLICKLKEFAESTS